MRGQVSNQVRFTQEDFAACGRRVTFPVMGKSPKDRRGTAQDERSALIFAFPPVPPFMGGVLLIGESGITGAQSIGVLGCDSFRTTGPWVCKICF